MYLKFCGFTQEEDIREAVQARYTSSRIYHVSQKCTLR